MSRARFRVVGRLDNAAKITDGTVTIDRGAGLLEVRPMRRRRTYALPLSTVATAPSSSAQPSIDTVGCYHYQDWRR